MTGTHILINQDPQGLLKEVETFTNKKAGVEKYYTTTPVTVGVLPNGQANIMIFTTCLIMWEISDEDWRSFLFAQKTLLQK